ncbi:hypothetical protein MATR_15850 [Marivirga tractuosa]|uniref:Outer membrane protein beta-barrel domain-containing protein n=1 Tax=Marivirga tractuosa (strain ATCC 23168 / DSM 4126 / NBRC 15989 / NCIMB 1408 / VKM B-1430 / H-43) TaxID=643867 RepID=E4TSG9_MARTH|nr:hypothetical protein [Marivirga tractuosa]ADR20789.1 hypothetical protein Ftrac_0787 [Marivirga tractuosa DSM 4126]BDD14760.1 hypothetical protein MATR_15850 [Marivirga tractuosa]
MRYYFLLLFLSIGYVLPLYPQEKDLNEYLVTESQDTLIGFVRPTSEVIHIEQGLYFKPDKNTPEKLYRMNQIVAYKDEIGRLHHKKLIPNQGRDSIFKFLEVLLIGEASLYQFNSVFYIEKGNKLYQLKDTDSEIRNDKGSLVLKHNKEYLAILSVLFSDCYLLYDEIMDSKMNYKSLISLLKRYHECTGSGYALLRDESQFEIEYNLGLYFGGFTTLSSQRLLLYKSSEVKGLSDQNLMFGADFYFRFQKSSKSYLIFSPHFSFNNQYAYNNSRIANAYWLYNYDLKYQFNQIDLPIGIGFTLNNRKVQPFVNASFVLSRLWKGTYNYSIRRGPASESEDSHSMLADFENDWESVNNIGLSASLGLNYRFLNRITLFNKVRYQVSNYLIEEDRIQNGEKFLNYHQFKVEFGVIF